MKLPTKAMLAGKTAKQAQRELEQEYHVSPPRAALAVECAQAALDVQKSLGQDGLSLYIGIPFCPTRCAYCSFISADIKGSLALVEPYVDALCREIELAGELLREKDCISRPLTWAAAPPPLYRWSSWTGCCPVWIALCLWNAVLSLPWRRGGPIP